MQESWKLATGKWGATHPMLDFGDLGMQEMLVVLLVALVFIGPKRLPEIARTLGRLMNELKRAGEELKSQIDLNSWTELREEESWRETQGSEPNSAQEPSSRENSPEAQQSDQPKDETETKVSEKTQA
jgi:Tat protein translocase TatB subunit